MTQIERSALLPYSCEQMFDLVNDVASYPKFLRHCRSTAVLSHSEQEMLARMDLAKGAVSQSFVTRNQLQRPESIRLMLEEGPFRFLRGQWRFQPLSEHSCKVSFHLEFEFKNRLISLAFGGLFGQIASSMVEAFSQRARQIYGSQSA